MHLRHDAWAELMNDGDMAGCLIPVLMLYHEQDTDPETRTNPIRPEKRDEIIIGMAAGLVQAYRYFRERMQRNTGRKTQYPSGTPKTGRNDPCPCGSGKKYK